MPPQVLSDDFTKLPPSNELDLHHFNSSEVSEVIDEFIWLCGRQSFDCGAIIHGKGTGALRELVHAKLGADPRVRNYSLAGANWGKTVFYLNM
jgi:DNA-nicking Smr family endonuclease